MAAVVGELEREALGWRKLDNGDQRPVSTAPEPVTVSVKLDQAAGRQPRPQLTRPARLVAG